MTRESIGERTTMSEPKRYPLTNAQSELLLDIVGLGKKARRYANMIGFCISERGMELDAAERVWNNIVENNDSLRLKIEKHKKDYCQFFKPYAYKKLERAHYGSLDEAKEKHGEMSIDAFAEELWLADLFTCDTGESGICVVLNHLCCDGYTIELLFSQFEKQYSDITAGNEPQPEKKPGTYVTAIEQNLNYFSSDAYREDRKWWEGVYKEQLHNKYRIPTRSRKRGGDGRYMSTELDAEAAVRLMDFAHSSRVSPEFLILAACALSTYAMSGDRIFSFYVLNHGRTYIPLRNTAGCMVTTVPLQIKINPEDKIADAITGLYMDYLEAMKHARFPNSEQVPMYVLKGFLNWFNFANNWLVFSAMTYQKTAEASPRRYDYLSFGYCTSQFYMGIQGGKQGYYFDLEYQPRMFREKLIKTCMEKALALLKRLPDDADKPVKCLLDKPKRRGLFKA